MHNEVVITGYFFVINGVVDLSNTLDSELLCKVVQGIKTVAGVKEFLVLPVAALRFAVVAGRIGADEFVSDVQRNSGGSKAMVPPCCCGEGIGGGTMMCLSARWTHKEVKSIALMGRRSAISE